MQDWHYSFQHSTCFCISTSCTLLSHLQDAACSGKRKTGAKKTALKFEYDGEDLTYLEQKLTQAEIDRVLGSDLLVRAVFHGQADVTGLLEVGSPTLLSSSPASSGS